MLKSESIGALAVSLAKAQGQFDAVPFNTTNNFLGNRYADLGAVIETAKPIIAEHGLSVAQLTEDGADGSIGITTILMHASGEWLSAFVSLPLGEEKGKSRAQVAGSIISYLRRYAYASILGLYAEEETDGNTDQHQTVSNRRDREQGGTVAETTKGRPTAKEMRDKAKEQQAASDAEKWLADWVAGIQMSNPTGWKPEASTDAFRKAGAHLVERLNVAPNTARSLLCRIHQQMTEQVVDIKVIGDVIDNRVLRAIDKADSETLATLKLLANTLTDRNAGAARQQPEMGG